MAHLRVVTDKPRARKPRRRLGLTAEQRERLSTALRTLHRIYGTWNALADEMGVCTATLQLVCSGRAGSMATLVAAANLLCVPVERLLNGSVVDAECCTTCGQRLPSITRFSCPSDLSRETTRPPES